MNANPTLVVGLAAEARVARPLGWPVVIGGGSAAGASAAAERAVRDGAGALISFGLAGGLDPALRPGMILVPAEVITGKQRFPTDPTLRQRLGPTAERSLLGATTIVTTAAAKAQLFATTGAVAIDLESGAVARVAHAHGLPFAVLRAICDPADRGLPPAALIALDQHGAIGLARVLASIASTPSQLPALMALAADAAAARRALRSAIVHLSRSAGEVAARERRG